MYMPFDPLDDYCYDFKTCTRDVFSFRRFTSDFARELETPPKTKEEDCELIGKIDRLVALLKSNRPGYFDRHSFKHARNTMGSVLSLRQTSELSASQQNQYCRRLNQAIQDLLPPAAS